MSWDTATGMALWQWFAVAGIWLVVLVLSAVVGSWVVTWVLRQASKGDLPWSKHDAIVVAQQIPSADREGVPKPDAGTMDPSAIRALRGGAWMGLLERLAITGTLLLGYPSGIALVIAIKGLGRYAELRAQPLASERFVIGTLASLVWASACGFIGTGTITLVLGPLA
ncbi:hypothetical protein [Myceligenerans pegani]|nr:hypothetical protein [Myceligenerans sp. TRM 65318]